MAKLRTPMEGVENRKNSIANIKSANMMKEEIPQIKKAVMPLKKQLKKSK